VGNFLVRVLNAHHFMSRKIILIIIGALLFLALLALLWFWFLHRSPATDSGAHGGFATSSNRSQGGTASQGQGNTPANMPPGSAAGQQQGGDGINITGGGIGTAGIGGVGTAGSGIGMSGSGIDMGSSSSSGSGSQASTSTAPGGITTGAWLGSNVSERMFNPSDIADLNDPGTLGGTPFISTTPQAAGLGNSGLVLGLTAAGCLAQWAANQIAGTVATAVDPATLGSAATGVVVVDLSAAKQRNESKSQTVMQCIVKSIAQAAIDQITRSIVNWVNSGFNGQPSFVTNFNQYFANVADQAAGEFIKGSALSFLCSPFAPQIKIAIAQSYANRNGSSGASCSLGKVTNNINGFLKGNWGAGGWGSLLQFTTVPTNNPYGAYAYAQIGLNNSIASAQNNANRNISPGGFISVQKCDNVPAVTAGAGSMPTRKNCKVTTPGQVIQDSLKASQDSSINQLNIAQDINSIINALTNQLVLKTLYGGLANANTGVTNPLAPAIDQAASAQAKDLLASLQASASYAVQYGSSKQGSASDIQQVQQNFNTLYNCWQTAASSTALSVAQQTQGAQGAASANTQILQLQAQIDALNTDITRANAAIASIQNLQSQVMFAATPTDITTASYAIQAATPSLISQADVTTAQQNRAALQTQLTATNQLAQSGLSQCHAVLGV
jgi:hypothetical protein